MGLFNKEDIFIVTGASSGLGRQTALDLIKEGASVVGVARSENRLEETKKMSEAPERFYTELRDFSKNVDSIEDWVNSLREKYGKFKGLAYCAGIASLQPARALIYSEMIDMFNINYFAPVILTKAISNKKNNVGNGTSIVAISSIAAVTKEKGMTIYSGCKASLSASLCCMAKEVAQKGIRINTVLPSDIKTPMTMKEEFIELRATQEQKYPLGFGNPEDVSNMIVYLLSNKAKWITAQSYVIDCGSI